MALDKLINPPPEERKGLIAPPSRESVLKHSSFFHAGATADFRFISPYTNPDQKAVWDTIRLPDPDQPSFTFNYLQLHVALNHFRESEKPTTFITTLYNPESNQLDCYQWNISPLDGGIKIEGSDISQQFRDALTGIGNRAFHELVKNTYDSVPGSFGCIVSGDLNDLKKTNDNQGHAAGDKLLIKASDLLHQELNPEDLIFFRAVSRTGGDEFVLFLPYVNIEDAQKIVDRLNQNITEYNQNGRGKNPPINVSFGIAAWSKDDGTTIDNAEKLADKRMYRQKAAKKAKEREAKEAQQTALESLGDISQFS